MLSPAGAAPAIQRIGVPTLGVRGSVDSAFGRAAAEATRDFVGPDYRFQVLEGVGHWIAEQVPGRANELLLEHLGANR